MVLAANLVSNEGEGIIITAQPGCLDVQKNDRLGVAEPGTLKPSDLRAAFRSGFLKRHRQKQPRGWSTDRSASQLEARLSDRSNLRLEDGRISNHGWKGQKSKARERPFPVAEAKFEDEADTRDFIRPEVRPRNGDSRRRGLRGTAVSAIIPCDLGAKLN